MDDQPHSVRRPRSRFKLVDMALDAVFNFTGPAQVSFDAAPPRGPRTEDEARTGFGDFERRTVGGHTYLVPKTTD